MEDKIDIRNYCITAIVLIVVLLSVIYLFFINQFPSKVDIALTEWRIVEIFPDNKNIQDIIKPDRLTDFSEYHNFKINALHVHNPKGTMAINGIKHELNPDDNIIISARRVNIDKNKKNELVIHVESRSIKYNDQIITMTSWSSLASGYKTTIIAGIFAIIASIIATIGKIIAGYSNKKINYT